MKQGCAQTFPFILGFLAWSHVTPNVLAVFCCACWYENGPAYRATCILINAHEAAPLWPAMSQGCIWKTCGKSAAQTFPFIAPASRCRSAESPPPKFCPKYSSRCSRVLFYKLEIFLDFPFLPTMETAASLLISSSPHYTAGMEREWLSSLLPGSPTHPLPPPLSTFHSHTNINAKPGKIAICPGVTPTVCSYMFPCL